MPAGSLACEAVGAERMRPDMRMKQRFTLIRLTLVVVGSSYGCAGKDLDDLFPTPPATPDGALSGNAGASAMAPSSPPPTAQPEPSSAAGPGSLPESGGGGAPQLSPAPPSTPADTGAPSAPSTETPVVMDEATEPVTEPEPEPPPCELGEFGAPEKLSGLALAEPLWGPALSLTDTGLFFAAGAGPEQLFFATRSDATSAQFSAASPVGELASDAFDGTPFVGASGLRLYFYSTREGSNAGSRDLWFAERPAVDAPFGPATPLTELNSPSFDLHPRASADELSIIFTSLRPEGRGRTDIWRARRGAVGAAFETPENVAELNTDADETGAWLSSDGLQIFFASNRAGGQGGLDFWRAARASTGAPFGPAEAMTELNTAGDELDIAFSSTERELIFSSNRDGTNELWRAVRECQ
jgi:hypothetical protein